MPDLNDKRREVLSNAIYECSYEKLTDDAKKDCDQTLKELSALEPKVDKIKLAKQLNTIMELELGFDVELMLEDDYIELAKALIKNQGKWLR